LISVLLIDNNDSFTFNLAESLRNCSKVNFKIIKTGSVDLENIRNFDKILISPGPGIPEEHPVIFRILEEYRNSKSILGICLGHQAIAWHFGAKLINLDRVRHGERTSINILSSENRLFKGLPGTFSAGLYHSWAVSREELPQSLRITALSHDGIIMALEHTSLDIRGVQFHPESIMTPYGQRIIENWVVA
jgi:anthranilate synthase/aminodeoxychorismate synthase-like glutamine amidotransferase